ncbi:MAG: DUF1786 family protein [Mailhella sp.]
MTFSPYDLYSPPCPTLLIDSASGSTFVMLALPETEFSRWPKAELPAGAGLEHAETFLRASFLPHPELTLVCTMQEKKAPAGSELFRARRMQRWKQELLRTEGRPEHFLRPSLPGWEAESLLSQARETFGRALGADSGIAASLAALSIPKVRERSWQEGITIIWAGCSHIQAFMIFQEKILGLYEQHTGISLDALNKDLHEMRMNWLPDEQVRAAGGHGCICGDFPPEAESFRPTWIFGPRQTSLEGCGRMVSLSDGSQFDRCLGLLFGLSLRNLA